MKNEQKQPCPECNGSGEKLIPLVMLGGNFIMTPRICIRCNGTGEIKKQK